MIVTDDYTSNPPGTPPMDGWVESCPRCGRAGVLEAQDGAEVIVHSERSELHSDGLLVEPADCCYL